MSVFHDYARYYNLLYRGKDYAGEAAFVFDMLKERARPPRTLLDLGCGTGRHAVEMARKGVSVTGVDMSETMLELGRESMANFAKEAFPASVPELRRGDARTVRFGRKFDAVVSLFHVMSYQNTEEDALAELITAREHLEPGGLFLFDFWHGPGVLRDLPECRERIFEDGDTRVRRVATPELRATENVVVVNYAMSITDRKSGRTTELREAHSMRYWFLPELRHLAKQAGLRVVDAGGWGWRNVRLALTTGMHGCLHHYEEKKHRCRHRQSSTGRRGKFSVYPGHAGCRGGA